MNMNTYQSNVLCVEIVFKQTDSEFSFEESIPTLDTRCSPSLPSPRSDELGGLDTSERNSPRNFHRIIFRSDFFLFSLKREVM